MEKWLLSSIHTLNMGYEHFFISNFKDFPGTLSFFAGSGSVSFLPGSRPVTNFFTSCIRIRINMIRIRHTGYVYVSESGPINSPNIVLAFFLSHLYDEKTVGHGTSHLRCTGTECSPWCACCTAPHTWTSWGGGPGWWATASHACACGPPTIKIVLLNVSYRYTINLKMYNWNRQPSPAFFFSLF